MQLQLAGEGALDTAARGAVEMTSERGGDGLDISSRGAIEMSAGGPGLGPRWGPGAIKIPTEEVGLLLEQQHVLRYVYLNICINIHIYALINAYE